MESAPLAGARRAGPERSAQRWTYTSLAPLARALSAATDLETVVQIIRRQAAATVGADLADVALLEDAVTVVSASSEPPIVEPIFNKYRRSDISSPLPHTRALRERQTIFVSDLNEYLRGHSDIQRDVTALAFVSAACAPLIDGNGDAIGVVTFGWRRGAIFDDAYRSVIETVAELCGQTIGRTRVTQRGFELAHLASALAGAATASEIAYLVAEHGRDVLGAAQANLRVVDWSSGTLESLLDVVLPEGYRDKYRDVHLDDDVPSADAVRRDRPVWLNNDPAYAARFADASRDSFAMGYASTAALPIHSSRGEPIGAIAMAWSRAMVFDEAFRATAITLAEVIGQALERAMLAERASRAAERNQTVAELAQRIAGEEDLNRIAGVLAAEIAPIMQARYADVTLASDRGLEVINSVDADAGRLAQILSARAIRTAQTVLLPDRSTMDRGFPELLSTAEDLGIHAAACVPLVATTGGAFGSLSFAWSSPRHLDRADLAVLTTMAVLAARTLERARLTTQATARAHAMGRLAETLATSMTTTQLAQALVQTVPDLLDSTHVVAIAVDDAQELRMSARSVQLDLPPALVDAAAVAYESGEPLLLPNRAARESAVGTHKLSADYEASAHLPLRDAHGHVRGVVCVMWSAPRAFDAETRALLATVADLAGATLERTRLYDSEHATITALQRRLLGPPATIDGFDIAVHYQPGDGAVAMGGDWYDTVVRDDGSLVVVIGDVAGHGVPAVAAMAQLQYLIAGLVQTNRSLDRVFSDINTMLARDDPGYATAQIFHFDPRTHRLGYQSAGHPWALLRRPDGRVERLDQGTAPPVGVARGRAGQSEPLVHTDFAPGTLLLAYTDGLVERRERSIVEGIDRLARAFASIAPDRDINEVLHDLVEVARGSGAPGAPLDDDVAAVLIRS